MADGSPSNAKTAWSPNPGPQTTFLASTAFELLYGGQAGGGKSDALLAGAVRYAFHRDYRAILFRRTGPELQQAKGLVERAWAMYSALGATPKKGGLIWVWPSGARIDLAAMELSKDRFKWKGPEFQYIGFDELTGFTVDQYLFLISRLRSSAGIPVRVRGASNPGGEGHDWVLERWAPWLYPKGQGEYRGPWALPGQKLFYRFDTSADRYVLCAKGDAGAVSRTFIPASLHDTPQLSGTGYEDRLDMLDALTRAQLKHGNWMARPAAGMMFRREWFTRDLAKYGWPTFVDEPCRNAVVRCRYWDLAATPKKSDQQAATASLVIAMDREGFTWVEHGTHAYGRPGQIKDLIRTMAAEDYARWEHSCPTIIEHDPGQAGTAQVDDFGLLLRGYNWRARRPSGDKAERAKPISGEAERGKVIVVRGDWNTPFFADLEGFPIAPRKDFVDALSGGHAECLRSMPALPPPPPPRPFPTRETARGFGGY